MKRTISGGIYLVIDPGMKEEEMLRKLAAAIRSDISAVQIWNNFPSTTNRQQLVSKVCKLCHERQVPVLVNDDPDLLYHSEADGIHFDEIPENFESVRELAGETIIGITCNNDLSVIKWADRNQLDYISFCSVFPSGTSNSCALVSFENIRKSRKLTSLPIFLAGGINPANMDKLAGLDIDGIAVISGIMGSEKPSEAIKEYQSQFRNINEKRNDQ